MILDCLILAMAVFLAVNGWNRGRLASWRGLIAMILATIAVRPYYIEFSTWIMSRLGVSPEVAVVIGYLVMWFSLEAVLEIVLTMVIRTGFQARPKLADRFGGIFYGVLKALTMVILPLMAISVDIKIPKPPANIQPILSVPDALSGGVYLVPGMQGVAKALVPIVGNLVVSTDAPNYKPVYNQPKKIDESAVPNKPVKQENKDLDELLK